MIDATADNSLRATAGIVTVVLDMDVSFDQRKADSLPTLLALQGARIITIDDTSTIFTGCPVCFLEWTGYRTVHSPTDETCPTNAQT
jgi:hypothetical protein